MTPVRTITSPAFVPSSTTMDAFTASHDNTAPAMIGAQVRITEKIRFLTVSGAIEGLSVIRVVGSRSAAATAVGGDVSDDEDHDRERGADRSDRPVDRRVGLTCLDALLRRSPLQRFKNNDAVLQVV